MTVHPTIKASWTHRLILVSARDGVMSDPCLLRKIQHRRGDAACLVRDARKRDSHPHACGRAREHHLVYTAEVADAENAARYFPHPRPEGHIEAVEDKPAEPRLVELL